MRASGDALQKLVSGVQSKLSVRTTLHYGQFSTVHRRSQYEANRGTRLGKILPNTVDFYFFYQTDNIRRFHTADFVQRTANGPCVRLGCSFFLATALLSRQNSHIFSS